MIRLVAHLAAAESFLSSIMTRIGILSDTHALWDDRYALHFADCDQIWHAGDIGSAEVADRLAAIAPLHAVVGNIDGAPLRRRVRSAGAEFPAAVAGFCRIRHGRCVCGAVRLPQAAVPADEREIERGLRHAV